MAFTEIHLFLDFTRVNLHCKHMNLIIPSITIPEDSYGRTPYDGGCKIDSPEWGPEERRYDFAINIIFTVNNRVHKTLYLPTCVGVESKYQENTVSWL